MGPESSSNDHFLKLLLLLLCLSFFFNDENGAQGLTHWASILPLSYIQLIRDASSLSAQSAVYYLNPPFPIPVSLQSESLFTHSQSQKCQGRFQSSSDDCYGQSGLRPWVKSNIYSFFKGRNCPTTTLMAGRSINACLGTGMGSEIVTQGWLTM